MKDGCRPNKLIGLGFVSLAAIIWGSNGVIVNLIPAEAIVIAFYRAFLATTFLTPIVLIYKHREFVDAVRDWKLLMINGLMNSLGWSFLFMSMKLIPIANAVLLNYLAPVFVSLLAIPLLKEKIRKVTIISLSLSIIGVVLILQNQIGGVNFLGVSYGLFSSLFYALFIIISKKIRERISSFVLASYTYIITLVIMTIIILLLSYDIYLEEKFLPLLTLMGVINTAIAVTIYFHGLGLIEAQRAVILTYLEPLTAGVLGAIVLGQTISNDALVGGILIILAGYLVTRY